VYAVPTTARLPTLSVKYLNWLRTVEPELHAEIIARLEGRPCARSSPSPRIRPSYTVTPLLPLRRRWLSGYLPTVRSVKDQKLAAQRVRDLEPFLGHQLLGRLSGDDCRACRLWLEKRTLSAQSVKHVLSDLRSLLITARTQVWLIARRSPGGYSRRFRSAHPIG
jgi:hypothetical protein